ncbi:putative response regulator [Lactococcus hodotermopsidis]|uniref:Putative response regulator n=1 Tax=Pseudolactococcus hodotermopsidis TaxID=2709157 RepID=A0A6A0BAW3_9LACT|nr:LytTR family DNA-binding domain-containing protein [Lactococcus hodotermopsidis]GFH42559.1 putative response regulator [Lactococcus hodotermopsidis]
MKVFILEDDQVQQFRLESLIRDYLLQKKYPNGGVVACGNVRDLLEELVDVPQNNIYFLDIAINRDKDAGLRAAEKIRQLDSLGQISFVTTHNEFAPITYEYRVNAHDFIDKILPQDEFDKKVLDNIDHYIEFNRIKPLGQIFSYKTRTDKLIEARYSDIYYFETTGNAHQLLLQMDGETVSFFGSLSKIDAQSDTFVRIHRSYLVNKERIIRYYKKEKLVLLDDDTELPVSRSGAKILGKMPAFS